MLSHIFVLKKVQYTHHSFKTLEFFLSCEAQQAKSFPKYLLALCSLQDHSYSSMHARLSHSYLCLQVLAVPRKWKFGIPGTHMRNRRRDSSFASLASRQTWLSHFALGCGFKHQDMRFVPAHWTLFWVLRVEPWTLRPLCEIIGRALWCPLPVWD